MGVHRIPKPAPDEICSTTHHTFLVGPWAGARLGAVHVREADDPEQVVLILQPADVTRFIHALAAAATGKPVAVDVHDLDPGVGRIGPEATVRCRVCPATTDVDMGRLDEGQMIGWSFTTDTGWRCPEHGT